MAPESRAAAKNVPVDCIKSHRKCRKVSLAADFSVSPGNVQRSRLKISILYEIMDHKRATTQQSLHSFMQTKVSNWIELKPKCQTYKTKIVRRIEIP